MSMLRSLFGESNTKNDALPEEMKLVHFEAYASTTKELEKAKQSIENLTDESRCLEIEISTLKEELIEKNQFLESLRKKLKDRKNTINLLTKEIETVKLALAEAKKEHEATKQACKLHQTTELDDESNVMDDYHGEETEAMQSYSPLYYKG